MITPASEGDDLFDEGDEAFEKGDEGFERGEGSDTPDGSIRDE